MSWPNSLQSNTIEDYVFYFKSSFGVRRLDDAPLEWQDATLVFERFLDSGGVFSTFNISALTFINAEATYLNDLFKSDEINAECQLLVKWFNHDTQTLESFPTEYEFDFKTFKIVKIDDFGIGVNLSVRKNGLLQKLNNRADIDVDITKTESIGGFSIIDYTDLKKWVRMPVIKSLLFGNFNESYGTRTSTFKLTLGLENITRSDFEGELQTVIDNSAPQKDLSFLVDSSRNRDINLNGSMTINYSVLPTTPLSSMSIRVITYNESGTQTGDKLLVQKEFPSISGSMEVVWDKDFTLLQGESMLCAIGFAQQSGIDDIFSWDNIDFNVKDTVIATTETNIECYPVYNATERDLQLRLDMQYPLYSEFFATNDDTYNASGDKYTTEDQKRFAVYTSGTGIRGESLTNKNNPLNLNWKDNFATLQACWCVGYGLENIEGNDRIRIEEYSYFFQDTEIIDFSSRISRLDIETEVISDICNVSVISGYENYDYESLNGRDEYNTENKRTTILNAESEFNNKAVYRGDTRGFAELLKQNINVSNSTDDKGDNDTFILKVQRNETLPAIDWDAEQEENIEVLDNSSIYDFGGLNLYLTPTRMLVRNLARWASGLQKQLSSFVRFQTAGKNQTLKTKGTTISGSDNYEVTENNDLRVNDIYEINVPLFRPIKHTVELKMTFEDVQTIQNNPYGLYRISSDKVGWILKVTKEIGSDSGVIEIIEKYIP